jgi:hypothetical protein
MLREGTVGCTGPFLLSPVHLGTLCDKYCVSNICIWQRETYVYVEMCLIYLFLGLMPCVRFRHFFVIKSLRKLLVYFVLQGNFTWICLNLIIWNWIGLAHLKLLCFKNFSINFVRHTKLYYTQDMTFQMSEGIVYGTQEWTVCAFILKLK